MLRKVKKYSELKEKIIKTIKKIINNANSPFLKYFKIKIQTILNLYAKKVSSGD